MHQEQSLNEISEEYGLADNFSCNATLNLINWHKRNEGGLWLAGDENNEETIRRLQSHPWIEIVDSDEDVDSTDEESEKGRVNTKDTVKEWQNGLIDVST